MADVIKLNTKTVAIACIILALLVVLLVMGFSALKVVAVFVILFCLPLFFILKSLKLDEGNTELFILSTFLGLGMISFFTFYVNRFIPSMRISAIIVWFVLFAMGIFLFFFAPASKKKSNHANGNE